MALTVKRTGSADYGFYVKMLVCGEPGSGKTLSASTWPNPLYANAEGGLMSIASRDIPTIDIASSGTLLELLSVLRQPAEVREQMLGVPVDTVVIDTIDEVGRILIKERLEQVNKDALAIADWGWYGEQMRAIVRAFRNLSKLNVIFNCHLKSVEDAETGTQFFKPAIQGAMGDELAGYVDIAGVLTARPITEVIDNKTHRRIIRILQTFPDVKRPWIKDRSGKLPMEFPINFEDDYKRLHEFIYGDIIEDHQPEVQETIVQTVDVAPTELVQREVATPEAESAKVEKVTEKVKAADQPPKKRGRPRKSEAKPVPQPAPEPVVEPAEPVVEPDGDGDAPAAVLPEPEPQGAEESVPKTETANAAGLPVCEECGNQVENADQAELSKIRFRQVLCRADFAARRKR